MGSHSMPESITLTPEDAIKREILGRYNGEWFARNSDKAMIAFDTVADAAAWAEATRMTDHAVLRVESPTVTFYDRVTVELTFQL